MIDLHTHILPKMDDGSQSVEETQKLLELLRSQGVTKVCATSHFYPEREAPEDFLRRRQASLELLPQALRDSLLIGAEVAYFPGIGSCDTIRSLQLGNTGLLLVEMPFRAWNDRIIADICAIPGHLGLTPVLAHVDRYRMRSQFPKYCKALLNNDVLFQCNADAFERGPGCRWALKQIKKGYIHFLGSDSHNLTTRPPKLDIALAAITKKLGFDAINYLEETANSLLNL